MLGLLINYLEQKKEARVFALYQGLRARTESHYVGGRWSKLWYEIYVLLLKGENENYFWSLKEHILLFLNQHSMFDDDDEAIFYEGDSSILSYSNFLFINKKGFYTELIIFIV